VGEGDLIGSTTFDRTRPQDNNVRVVFFNFINISELNDYRLTPVGSLFECNSRY
jgi:hypothetical protein